MHVYAGSYKNVRNGESQERTTPLAIPHKRCIFQGTASGTGTSVSSAGSSVGQSVGILGNAQGASNQASSIQTGR